jgi:hypothetical protein
MKYRCYFSHRKREGVRAAQEIPRSHENETNQAQCKFHRVSFVLVNMMEFHLDKTLVL